MSYKYEQQNVVEADMVLVAADPDDDTVFCLMDYGVKVEGSEQL